MLGVRMVVRGRRRLMRVVMAESGRSWEPVVETMTGSSTHGGLPCLSRASATTFIVSAEASMPITGENTVR